MTFAIYYPPAGVRAAFADLLSALGVRQWTFDQGGSRSRRVAYSLCWCEQSNRWGVLRHSWDDDAEWFAFPICADATQPH